MNKKYIGFLFGCDDSIEVKKLTDYQLETYWDGGIDIENGMRMIDADVMLIGDDKNLIKKELEKFLEAEVKA